MNGVKLEHMCHYSVNLSLCCDVVVSASFGRPNVANVPNNQNYLHFFLQKQNASTSQIAWIITTALLQADVWVQNDVFLSQQMFTIISHPFTGLLEIVRDLAWLHRLDTRRKANRFGLPDCDSEIYFSLDQLVPACPVLSVPGNRRKKDCEDPSNSKSTTMGKHSMENLVVDNS